RDHNDDNNKNDNDKVTTMYRIRFTKMHGAGNDFVLFKRNGKHHNDYGHEPLSLDELSYISKSIANRKLGVGCDQVIIVTDAPSPKSDYEMLIYNQDGSVATMCGNGVRCFSKYITDNRIPSVYMMDGGNNVDEVYEERMFQRVHTLAGIIITYPLAQSTYGLTKLIKVNMGSPLVLKTNAPPSLASLSSPEPPTTTTTKEDNRVILTPITGQMYYSKTINVLGMATTTCTSSSTSSSAAITLFQCILVSMGNPHCVVFLEDNIKLGSLPTDTSLDTLDIADIGKKIEADPIFIDSCNVEFVTVCTNHLIRKVRARVWERGTGETLACGTGACAVAVASILTGKCQVDETVSINMPGGELLIDWNQQEGKVYKTGPATTVFTSEIDIVV
ncbi:hypothetical protein SAMD00019534_034890, partial [Acytostelium subglobosum LB1]|uniref:hypothetical protein n=1 Tax=Acytostelium subglobosum LB1 TaxID=1410327 RepID=UPI0006449DEC